MGMAEASPQPPWRGGLKPDLEGWGEGSLAEAVGAGRSDSVDKGSNDQMVSLEVEFLRPLLLA